MAARDFQIRDFARKYAGVPDEVDDVYRAHEETIKDLDWLYSQHKQYKATVHWGFTYPDGSRSKLNWTHGSSSDEHDIGKRGETEAYHDEPTSDGLVPL